MNLREKAKNILATALTQWTENWKSRPTGMIPESMRSFSFVSSHNHTPYINSTTAQYIELCDPKTISSLCRRLESLEATLNEVAEILEVINGETTSIGIATKVDQKLAQEALDLINKLKNYPQTLRDQ